MIVVADRRAGRLEHVLGRREPGVRVLEPERARRRVRRVGGVGHRHPQHALHALDRRVMRRPLEAVGPQCGVGPRHGLAVHVERRARPRSRARPACRVKRARRGRTARPAGGAGERKPVGRHRSQARPARVTVTAPRGRARARARGRRPAAACRCPRRRRAARWPATRRSARPRRAAGRSGSTRRSARRPGRRRDRRAGPAAPPRRARAWSGQETSSTIHGTAKPRCVRSSQPRPGRSGTRDQIGQPRARGDDDGVGRHRPRIGQHARRRCGPARRGRRCGSRRRRPAPPRQRHGWRPPASTVEAPCQHPAAEHVRAEGRERRAQLVPVQRLDRHAPRGEALALRAAIAQLRPSRAMRTSSRGVQAKSTSSSR